MDEFDVLDLATARTVQRAWARQLHQHYVYVLYRLDNGDPFYVGKGSKDRFAHHVWSRDDNRHKRAVVRKSGGTYRVQFHGFYLFEDEAFEAEREAISNLIGLGFALTNQTPGGDCYFSTKVRQLAIANSTIALRRPEHLARLAEQGRRSGAMAHVRAVRSDTINRLQHDPAFATVKMAAVRQRYELRRQALVLLATRALPKGFALPSNLKTGGTLVFWRALVERLKGD